MISRFESFEEIIIDKLSSIESLLCTKSIEKRELLRKYNSSALSKIDKIMKVVEASRELVRHKGGSINDLAKALEELDGDK